jgi:hypothetical protein
VKFFNGINPIVVGGLAGAVLYGGAGVASAYLDPGKKSKKQRRRDMAEAGAYLGLSGGIAGAYLGKTVRNFRNASKSYKYYKNNVNFNNPVKFFKDIKTKKDFENTYKRLAIKYHPDRNPTGGEIMKDVTNEYRNLKNSSWFQKLAMDYRNKNEIFQ